MVGRHQYAWPTGDFDATVGTFELVTATYARPPTCGWSAAARPTALVLRSTRFRKAGGIALEQCTVTDDSVRCAREYNCVRWGGHQVTPQAGIAVYVAGQRTACRPRPGSTHCYQTPATGDEAMAALSIRDLDDP